MVSVIISNYLPRVLVFGLGVIFLGAAVVSHAQCPDRTHEGEAADDRLGWSVAGAGYVDMFSAPDYIIGAPWNDAGGMNAGRVYVLSGAVIGDDTLFVFTGEAAGDQFGFSVSDDGEVNPNSYSDVIVGAPYSGAVDIGKAYVFAGISGSAKFTFTGEYKYDHFGWSVSGAGDVNDDGRTDFIVGAPHNDVGGGLTGRAYVYSGDDGSLLYVLTGEAAGDAFGSSVAGAGDINNDGYADFIVGAPNNDAGGNAAGRAYIFLGRLGFSTRYLSAGEADIILTGEAGGDHFGSSVGGAGEVDYGGHIYDDVIVGAPNNAAGGVDAGRAYVFFGYFGSYPDTIPAADANLIFTGEAAGDEFGTSVAGAGDVNADSYGDLIIGAPFNDAGGADAGRAYIYTGPDGDLLFPLTGEEPGGEFGHSVSGAGKLSHAGSPDNYGEVIIGAHYADVGGSADAGRAFVYRGNADNDVDLISDFCDNCPRIYNPGQADIDGDGLGDACDCPGLENPSLALYGKGSWPAPVEYDFGFSVAGIEDLNNDGRADLLVGIPHTDFLVDDDPGTVRVFSGIDGDSLFSLSGEMNSDQYGFSVAGAGDVNHDTWPDIVVGAPQNDATGSDAGRTYIVSGPDGSELYHFDGEAAGDRFGWSVDGAGDVDDDGFADIVVGSPYNDQGGPNAGKAYIYSGQGGGLLYSFLGETAGDAFGYWVSGAGDVNNDGYDDIIIGAPYNDAGGGGAGKAYVFSGWDGDSLYVFTGFAANEKFGFKVSEAGDVNNDGYADVIVGGLQGSGGIGAGRAYVLSGQSGGVLYSFTGETGSMSTYGWPVEDYPFGLWSVAGAGDVDGDDFDDLIVGASGYGYPGGNTDGYAFVYSGESGALLHAFFGSGGFGWSIGGAGDVTGDNLDDIIVGRIAGFIVAGSAFVYPLSGDTDDDGWLDACDNCWWAYNPDQADSNDDGIGDACDNCVCTEHCDLNLDGQINPLDVVFIVNYVYKSQDARVPNPPCDGDNGDWNCDDLVNPLDVVYYVNYVYKSIGSGPCDPCIP